MDILAEWEGVLSSTIASISADSEIQLENAEIQVLELTKNFGFWILRLIANG